VTADELAADWAAIACILVWKTPEHRVALTRKELRELPLERVLMTDTAGDQVVFRWVTVKEAQRQADTIASLSDRREKASVEQLQGRWQKTAVVLLWHLARDGVTLVPRDKDELPSDQVMLASTHGDTVEWEWMPRARAKTIQDWERDNRGRIIVEGMK
jgi:hypothetical protein